MLAAFYTVLFQVNTQPLGSKITSNLANVFIEFSIIHLTMFIFFFIFSIIRGKDFLKCKEPKLILWRSTFAIISLWCYSLARVWTSTVDNSMLYSIDALCIVIFLALLGIKISKTSLWGIIIGAIGIAFVYAFALPLGCFLAKRTFLSFSLFGFYFCKLSSSFFSVSCSKSSCCNFFCHFDKVLIIIWECADLNRGLKLPKLRCYCPWYYLDINPGYTTPPYIDFNGFMSLINFTTSAFL